MEYLGQCDDGGLSTMLEDVNCKDECIVHVQLNRSESHYNLLHA